MAPKRWRKRSWRHWRRDVFPSQARCGGPTPAACSSGSSLKAGSCTHFTLSTMASKCPGLWSASSGLVPTRWIASSPGRQRKLSSPSSWWPPQPSAWCWMWPSCATSSWKHCWGAWAGRARENTLTRRTWVGTTRRTRCCCRPPQIHPARLCVEEQREGSVVWYSGSQCEHSPPSQGMQGPSLRQNAWRKLTEMIFF